jgi:hypothetical protein
VSPDGRTFWLAKDSGWWRRELIVLLGQEFGATGPAVIDWLSCEARAQNDDGRVMAGYATCSAGCFTGDVPLRPLLSRAVSLGLLDDFQEVGEHRFTCRISGWSKDQPKGQAALKKAQQRSKTGSTEPKPASGQKGTEGDSVPVCPPREEEEKNRSSSSSSSERAHTLNEQVTGLQRVFSEFGPAGCVLDEISAANAISRYPQADHSATAHACAEYLRQHPQKPVGMTFQRFLENDVRAAAKTADAGKPKKRFENERTDFSHYDDLVSQ